MSEALTASPPAQSLARLDVAAIMTLAVEKGVPVDTMERIMAMRKEVNAEAAKEAYYAALSDFQMDCPIIAKEKAVMNKDGKSVRYNYAPLDAIVRQVRPLLKEHGFSYRFETATENNEVKVSCVALHRDGHAETSTFQARIDPDAYMNVQQRFGSALTFAKRYAFCNAFGILTGEDDDDSQATTPDGPAQRRMERIRAMQSQAQAQDAEVVNRGPEEGDSPKPVTEVPLDNATLDFVTQVNDASNAAELTRLALDTRNLEGVALKAAKRAINTRAQALRLTWDPKQEVFRAA